MQEVTYWVNHSTGEKARHYQQDIREWARRSPGWVVDKEVKKPDETLGVTQEFWEDERNAIGSLRVAGFVKVAMTGTFQEQEEARVYEIFLTVSSRFDLDSALFLCSKHLPTFYMQGPTEQYGKRDGHCIRLTVISRRDLGGLLEIFRQKVGEKLEGFSLEIIQTNGQHLGITFGGMLTDLWKNARIKLE